MTEKAGNPVFIGLDLGTTGVRVVAVDLDGHLVAEATGAYPLLTPFPGWTEQRPEEWMDACYGALHDLVGKLDGQEVGGLSFSGQMHGMVPLDAAGNVIRPAPLWNDQRTGEQVEAIERAVPRAELIRRTGNRAATGFQLPKVLWLRDEEPEAFGRLAKVLLPKDYVSYELTGRFAAEPSDGSGTGCLNLAAKSWDREILSAVGLTDVYFPEVIGSSDVVGGLTESAAVRCGLPAGLPIVAGAGDNAAAATGLGISNRFPNRGSISLGTSGVIFMPLSEPRPEPEGRVHLFCHADGDYHLLGVTLSAAGSLQWYHDTLARDVSFAALTEKAAESTPGSNGVTFRPYLAGERTPHMNPDLRGSWTGLSLANTEPDLIRSVMEGVAFSLRDAFDLVSNLASVDHLLATGGGARSDLWLQMAADVLQVPLLRPNQDQGAAYGAALLAMIGVGAITSIYDVLGEGYEGDDRVTPGNPEPYVEPLNRYRENG
jgi:xylulokinase